MKISLIIILVLSGCRLFNPQDPVESDIDGATTDVGFDENLDSNDREDLDNPVDLSGDMPPDFEIGVCGNGVIDPGESCEAAIPLSERCIELGSGLGAPSCNACQIDTSSCEGCRYYFDASSGDDQLDGATPDSAFSSLLRLQEIVAGSPQFPYGPGDAICFRRGETWSVDQSVILSVNGAKNAPMYFVSYGDVDQPPPLFDGGMELEFLEVGGFYEARSAARPGVLVVDGETFQPVETALEEDGDWIYDATEQNVIFQASSPPQSVITSRVEMFASEQGVGLHFEGLSFRHFGAVLAVDGPSQHIRFKGNRVQAPQMLWPFKPVADNRKVSSSKTTTSSI